MEHRIPFLVPDRRPFVRFDGRGTLLSSKAKLELDIESCNLERVLVRVYRAYENNAAFLATHELVNRSGRSAGSTRATSRRPKITGRCCRARRTRPRRRRSPSRNFFGEDPRGVYRLELREDADSWSHFDHILLQVSDLGVQVRSGASTALVRVHRIADGSPRVGARVRAYSRANQLLAEARTAENGCARLKWDASVSDRKPFLIEAWDGEDRSFVDFVQSATVFPSDELAGRPYVGSGEIEAWCHTDRGIVRPGETVHATMLVRDGGGRTPVGRELVLTWKDPGGRIAGSEELEVPADGLLSASLATETSSPTGPWRLELREKATKSRVGTTRFSVEDFVPERIAAKDEFDAEPRIGGTGQARISAEWLNGGAAAGLRYRAWIRFDTRTTELEAHAGYSFDGDPEAAAPGARPMLEGALDADGEAVLRFRVPEHDGARFPARRDYASRSTNRPGVRCAAFAERHRLAPAFSPGSALRTRPTSGKLQRRCSCAAARMAPSSMPQPTGHVWHWSSGTGAAAIRRIGGQPPLLAQRAASATCSGSTSSPSTGGRGQVSSSTLPNVDQGGWDRSHWLTVVAELEGERGRLARLGRRRAPARMSSR